MKTYGLLEGTETFCKWPQYQKKEDVMRSVHVLACSLLALVFSASVFAADGTQNSPCSTAARDSAPITVEELRADRFSVYRRTFSPADSLNRVFPASVSPRCVDAFLIRLANVDTQENCSVTLYMGASEASFSSTILAEIGAGPSEGEQLYMLLPRPIYIDSGENLRLKIEGVNGCYVRTMAYSRPATGTKTMAAVVTPAKIASTVSLVGAWASTVGSTYDISQDNDKFTWDVNVTGEKGTGTISDLQVQASWDGPRGSGSGNGKVSLDATGKAVRIEWENGVVFFRD